MANPADSGKSKKTWQYKLGLVLFFGAFPVFFATPVAVPVLGLSALDSAALIGGVLLAVEILWIISIVLLGKEGFNEVKHMAFGWLKLGTGPISRARHRLGVSMLAISVILDVVLNLVIVGIDLFAEGAADPTTRFFGLDFKRQAAAYVGIQILTTLGVIAGIFLLGADFWERIKKAFEWHPPEARVSDA